MPSKNKVKLNKYSEINLIWTDDEVQLLLQSARNVKTENMRKCDLDPTTSCFFLNIFLFFFVKC